LFWIKNDTRKTPHHCERFQFFSLYCKFHAKSTTIPPILTAHRIRLFFSTLINDRYNAVMPTYPETLTLTPLAHAPDATVAIPGSKSITNRALILAALANGTSTLTNALFSDDTQVMAEALRVLGFAVETDAVQHTITVQGQGGRIPADRAELFCSNSGTSIRFLTALCALGRGIYRLDGVERMRQRPQGDLLDALQSQGMDAVSEFANGCPPLQLRSENGLRGGEIRIRADASSQFVTALLMAAPYAQNSVELVIEGNLRPHYVTMTRRMMAQWGVQTEETARGFAVPSGQTYAAQSQYVIEPDASSASYFFGAAALLGGRVTISNLTPDALQGDMQFATQVLAAMGCDVTADAAGITVTAPADGKLHGIQRDMSAISDTSLTLAVLAPFADSPTTVSGIAHSRLQECDRIAAVCTELQKLGVRVDEHPDGFTIYPAETFKPAAISTYHDHRVAMSFALIGLKIPGVTIENPACVAKTFPDYWQRLEELRR
jgi:3-phosphoshikimate 1-carboxyvinyltransferase